ncbi:MAG: methyltransferase domain-containing protein [Pseudomonadaceae bacterium]|nr:methyltransferase domain-containing protein [Pseudomonadaceae bacterium]
MNDYSKLNLGCGQRPNNKFPRPWLNVDREGAVADITWDIADLPQAWNATFDEVRVSHVLEHFFLAEVPNVLAGWLRVLKPNGVLRVIVPDLDIILKNLQDGIDAKGRTALSTTETTPVLAQIYGIGYDQASTGTHWRHRMIYNEAMLRSILLQTGQLTNITRYSKVDDPAYGFGIVDDSQNIFSLGMKADKVTTHEMMGV